MANLNISTDKLITLDNLSKYNEQIENKIPVLSAGENITLTPDEEHPNKITISSTGGESYEAGEGIDITDGTISTETRIIDILQADYDELSEEEKMDPKVFYNITDAEGGSGGSGSGGGGVSVDTSKCYKTSDTVTSTINDTDYFPLSDSSNIKKKTLWTTLDLCTKSVR